MQSGTIDVKLRSPVLVVEYRTITVSVDYDAIGHESSQAVSGFDVEMHAPFIETFV